MYIHMQLKSLVCSQVNSNLQGDSGTVKLDNNKNNFEPRSEDNFTIECLDLGILYQYTFWVLFLGLNNPHLLLAGSLTKIKIWHDGSGPSSSWFLSHVTVTSANFTNPFYFYSNSWLIFQYSSILKSNSNPLKAGQEYSISSYTRNTCQLSSSTYIQNYCSYRRRERSWY